MITKLLLDYLKLCLGVGELSICYIFGWRVSLFPYLFSIVCMCWVCKSIHQKGIWANFTNKNRESKSRRSTYRVFRKSFIFSRLSADPSLAQMSRDYKVLNTVRVYSHFYQLVIFQTTNRESSASERGVSNCQKFLKTQSFPNTLQNRQASLEALVGFNHSFKETNSGILYKVKDGSLVSMYFLKLSPRFFVLKTEKEQQKNRIAEGKQTNSKRMAKGQQKGKFDESFFILLQSVCYPFAI